MKTSFIKLYTLLLLVSMAFAANAGITEEYEKLIEEDFACNQETLLNINNQYGDINVKNWDKNSILIKVIITLETTSEEKAKLLFSNFDIKMYKSKNTVWGKTRISPQFKTSKKFKVDYEITMPKYVRIDFTNKFGDISINTLKAHANITLSYGNLQGETFLYPDETSASTINLSYAKANILQCNSTHLNMKYSKINIDKCNNLKAVSRYSKLHLTDNESTIIDSKYDAINIKNTNSLIVSMGQYSNIKIDNVTNILEMHLRYGNFSIGNIDKMFESITIDNQYVAGRIAIAENSEYTLNAKTKYCSINYPNNAHVIENITQRAETTLKVIVGNPAINRGKVNIKSEYGNISLF